MRKIKNFQEKILEKLRLLCCDMRYQKKQGCLFNFIVFKSVFEDFCMYEVLGRKADQRVATISDVRFNDVEKKKCRLSESKYVTIQSGELKKKKKRERNVEILYMRIC